MAEQILLAIDESAASRRAVEYVAAWADGARFTVRVVHVLEPIPVALLGPAERASFGLSSPEADRWLASSKETARATLLGAVERLTAAGIDAERVEYEFLSVHPEGSAVSGLLQAAQEHGCGTIVVGRSTLPWHREMFHHHFADELLRKAEGFTVWVVE